MRETDDVLWTQLFQDKPISRRSLENFQAKLMADIVANPVNFKEEINLAERRKWGLGLLISLLFVGVTFGAFIWFKGDLVFQGLGLIMIMISGLPNFSDLQQVGHSILQDILLFSELKAGLGLLWGVVSWPILGVLAVFVIFSSSNPARKPTI